MVSVVWDRVGRNVGLQFTWGILFLSPLLWLQASTKMPVWQIFTSNCTGKAQLKAGWAVVYLALLTRFLCFVRCWKVWGFLSFCVRSLLNKLLAWLNAISVGQQSVETISSFALRSEQAELVSLLCWTHACFRSLPDEAINVVFCHHVFKEGGENYDLLRRYWGILCCGVISNLAV